MLSNAFLDTIDLVNFTKNFAASHFLEDLHSPVLNSQKYCFGSLEAWLNIIQQIFDTATVIVVAGAPDHSSIAHTL